MRILALIDDVYRPGLGGMQVIAQAVGERLAGRGHEVTFLAAARDESVGIEYHAGVRVVRYPATRTALGFVRAGMCATRALRGMGPFDIVHTHFAYAAVGPNAVIPRGVPRIRTYHGAWHSEAWIEKAEPRGQNGAKRMIGYAMRYSVERHDLRRSERVFVLSETASDQVLRLDVRPSVVDVVPAGIDRDRFRPGDRVDARRRLGLPLTGPVLAYVGRLVRLKGVDNLINALPLVRARHAGATLVVAGAGPEREALERLAGERGVAEHVRFTGHVDASLAEHYRSADVCVVPSIAAETLGLVSIEALACGTPVLGTPSGALVEILSALDTRMVAAGTTAEALAGGISSVLSAAAAGAFPPARLAAFVEPYAAGDGHAELVERRCEELLALRSAGRGSSRDPRPGA
jgi:glycosyltransferase involved in cell wall biosynthesis